MDCELPDFDNDDLRAMSQLANDKHARAISHRRKYNTYENKVECDIYALLTTTISDEMYKRNMM